ncbi:MAG TPA: hypothetical protein PKM71_07970 [Candidatus Cloacimonas sp.]|nr:hypothetical protein [Candidatus Cloacimonas sp.]
MLNKSVQELPETTKAYLAGLIDGEGSLYIHRDYKKGNYPIHNAKFSVGMTDKLTIDFVAKNLGLEVKERFPKNPKHRKVYEIRCGGSDKVKAILDIIYPYLVSKKKQADNCYLMIRHKKACIGKRLTSRMLNFREKIFFANTALNVKKGKNSIKPIPDRKQFCKRCLRVLPENFLGDFHKECYVESHKEKFGGKYQRDWYRKSNNVPPEKWRN